MLRQALSTTLSSLPERFHRDRTELLDLLRLRGILHRSPTQPVLSRDGSSARWMLDSLNVTLTSRGGELAGRCILELLKRYDARQIATYGLTAVPILQSCVALSGGNYHGILIRKERKKHGSLRLIEGPIDPDQPVVLIDDSISSGTSMTEACELLEKSGVRVEGGIFLVRFGWYGGYALMQERGYHVEAVSDIWEDFIQQMEDEEKPLRNPSKWFPQFEWSSDRAPEGLHPAELARLAIAKYLSSGHLLRAPERMDKQYDSSGGAWVSIRSRANLHVRPARDGFWHFPDEAAGSAANDVMLASLRTASALPGGAEGLRILEESGIAVTFFTALEKCNVGQLDNERYGIVVRSLERPEVMGGALPQMPGISAEWEQFQHARKKNAGLISFEPYEILRHEVVKAIEPGISWQPTGVPKGERAPWHEDENILGQLAMRARDIVLSRLFYCPERTAPLDPALITDDVDSLYVTTYFNGLLCGCMGSTVRDLENDLSRLAIASLNDDRFKVHCPTDPKGVAVSVSVLFNPLELGEASPEEILPYFKHGEHALMAYRDDRVGLLLPFVASTHNLDSPSFAQAVAEKAALESPPYYWCRFDCVTWLADDCQTAPLVGGFALPRKPASSLEDLVARLAPLHVNYLIQHQREDGVFYSAYEPFQNKLYESTNIARLAHAAWVMARARAFMRKPQLKDAAEKAVAYLADLASENEAGWWLKNEDSSVSEVAFLLLALNCLPEDSLHHSMFDPLARTLWSRIELPHGRVSTHVQPTNADDTFQDYLPGQVLLALANATEKESALLDESKLVRSFRYYRHRFRYQRHFGQVSWLMQAFAKWWRITEDPEFAEFVFEIGDWIIGYQQEKTGAFINDHQSQTPGYTTALYLEGIGAALNLSRCRNDEERYERYLESFLRGLVFLDRLIIQPRDASVLPNPKLAIGGLRESIHSSWIRVDFVQHSLSAMLEFGDYR